MKSVFFALAFMLMGSFAFANSQKMTYIIKNAITVITSCGETGMIIVQDGDTIEDVLDMVNDMEEWLCG